MRKIRTIKELLEIDIESLSNNSKLISDSKDEEKKYLLYELKINHFKIFDQLKVSVFKGTAKHLEFRVSQEKSNEVKKIVKLIVSEYGTDENNQNATSWNTGKYMTWWFKNKEHEKSFDEPFNTEDLYYGIIIDGMNNKKIKLSLINYSNIESNLKNWSQQRV